MNDEIPKIPKLPLLSRRWVKALSIFALVVGVFVLVFGGLFLWAFVGVMSHD